MKWTDSREIALALATKPAILLLDEPAAGIPSGESAELFSVIAARASAPALTSLPEMPTSVFGILLRAVKSAQLFGFRINALSFCGPPRSSSVVDCQ